MAVQSLGDGQAARRAIVYLGLVRVGEHAVQNGAGDSRRQISLEVVGHRHVECGHLLGVRDAIARTAGSRLSVNAKFLDVVAEGLATLAVGVRGRFGHVGIGEHDVAKAEAHLIAILLARAGNRHGLRTVHGVLGHGCVVDRSQLKAEAVARQPITAIEHLVEERIRSGGTGVERRAGRLIRIGERERSRSRRVIFIHSYHGQLAVGTGGHLDRDDPLGIVIGDARNLRVIRRDILGHGKRVGASLIEGDVTERSLVVGSLVGDCHLRCVGKQDLVTFNGTLRLGVLGRKGEGERVAGNPISTVDALLNDQVRGAVESPTAVVYAPVGDERQLADRPGADDQAVGRGEVTLLGIGFSPVTQRPAVKHVPLLGRLVPHAFGILHREALLGRVPGRVLARGFIHRRPLRCRDGLEGDVGGGRRTIRVGVRNGVVDRLHQVCDDVRDLIARKGGH